MRSNQLILDPYGAGAGFLSYQLSGHLSASAVFTLFPPLPITAPPGPTLVRVFFTPVGEGQWLASGMTVRAHARAPA